MSFGPTNVSQCLCLELSVSIPISTYFGILISEPTELLCKFILVFLYNKFIRRYIIYIF